MPVAESRTFRTGSGSVPLGVKNTKSLTLQRFKGADFAGLAWGRDGWYRLGAPAKERLPL
jgi:hypothetical protein